jgi:hypothetical protein
MMMVMIMMLMVSLAQDPATDKMVEKARLPIAARMAGEVTLSNTITVTL